jgi:hypothetical protein
MVLGGTPKMRIPAVPSFADRQRPRGWSFRDFAMTAACIAAMPDGFERFGNVYLEAARGSGHYAIAAATAALVTELVVVSGAAYFAADPVRKAVSSKASEAAAAAREFFEKHGLMRARRKAVFSASEAYSSALEKGLDAAGVPHVSFRDGGTLLVVGDALRMQPVLDHIDSMRELTGLDRTVVSLVAHGSDAPVVMRQFSDGGFAATWADGDGVPLKTVGYDSDGRPGWAFDHQGGEMADATSEPAVGEALASMEAACSVAAEQYVERRKRMAAALDFSTHRLELRDDGTLAVRNAIGKLDSPGDEPALLSPDGTAVWARGGLAVRKASIHFGALIESSDGRFSLSEQPPRRLDEGTLRRG